MLKIVAITASLNLLTGQLIPVQANCSDPIASPEWHEPMFTEHFQRLQSQSSYPWGNVPVYDRIEGTTIFLTESFEQLNGPQKRQALDTLLKYNRQDYIIPEEYEQERYIGGYGRLPHRVIASDGRLISVVYDGCTRFTLLTEQARYSWIYVTQRHGGNPDDLLESQMRNAGQPNWRQVNFPIDPATERSVRLGFWNSVGYEQQWGWWIAWVPEHGYFEINVPEDYDSDRLERYWQVTDRNYRYIVVSQDGSQLAEKRF